MPVLLIFIDGIGLGEENTEKNPFARFLTPFFSQNGSCPLTRHVCRTIFADMRILPTDACLGVAGLPQSATGQAAMLTGVNFPQLVGRHVPGFPGPSLARLIRAGNIMKDLTREGYAVTSANMYVPNYFELVAKRKRKNSVTTLAILSSDTQLRSTDDMCQGAAVYQDITNEMLPLAGVKGIPVISPDTAAQRVLNIAANHDFTLFEYFQTDRCGHKRNWNWAEKIIHELDEFLMAVYTKRNDDMLIVITSDHGNFEDFSTKTHTRNLVPTILIGSKIDQIEIENITHITPGIVSWIRKKE